MNVTTDTLRMILGLKVKRLRQERGFSLTDLAAGSGLSVSYLSEIENGRKYPKAEKLIGLSRALGVPFDELVSVRVGEELEAVTQVLGSSFVREFPFDLFGVRPEDLVGVVAGDPEKAAALFRTFLEVGRTYDVQVEHFLFAALRSYQQMHRNYFEDLEEEAAAFRRERGWSAEDGVDAAELRRVLEEEYGYEIDEATLADHAELGGFRSVYVDGAPPRLHVNGRLLPAQKAFIFGREIGYRRLELEERAVTSSWLKVESFDQVLNNFRASYFSGALLIDREMLRRRMAAFLERDRWDGEAFLAMMRSFRATPEMFFYRLSELLPALFGLNELYFMRFHSRPDGGGYRLTKFLNMSGVPVPYGIALDEHYCRRWPAMKLLAGLASAPAGDRRERVSVRAQRSRFLGGDAEFFVVSVARPLALAGDVHSCVSLGLRLDDRLRRLARFWDDPAVPRVEVHLTCERCPLAPEACSDRAAAPTIHLEEARQARQEAALAALLAG